MEKRRIRKRLEVPLLIYGLRKPLFYRFLMVIVFGVVALLYAVVSMMHGSGTSWSSLLITVAIVAVMLIAVYLYLVSQSRGKKFDFPKRESIISNRDLYRYIRQ